MTMKMKMIIKLDAICSLSLFLSFLSAYPIYESRIPESSVSNSARDYNYWVRPEPEPLYGYPDYGDYGEPRPVYSELDIVRQQLARPPHPFPLTYIKRFPPPPPPPPVPVYENSWDDDSSYYNNNGFDNELPRAFGPPVPVFKNPGLEALTEALRDALIQQGEVQDLSSLIQSESVEDDENALEDTDEMVKELKETAVKKSGPSLVPVPTKSDTLITAPWTTTILPDALQSSEDDKGKGSGQKEIPLLRPPKRPVTANDNGSKRTATNLDQQTNFSRYKNHHQRVNLVSSDDDLMQELNGLKKRHQ